MAMGLSSTCPACDTACKDASGKDLLDGRTDCGLACQQCKQGTAISGGSALSIGLVGHWKFDETAGLAASDSSGQGNIGTFSGEAMSNGALINTPGRITGQYGKALQFSGANYVNIPDSDSLDIGTGDFSILFWIRTTQTNIGGVLWKNYQPGYSILIGDAGPGKLKFEIGDSLGYSTGPTTATINDGTWKHIALTVDRDTFATWYINGNPDSTHTGVVSRQGSLANSNALTIGKYSGVYFNGDIDSFRVFNRVLTQSEVQAERNSPRPTIRLISAWEFDESSPTTAEDTHIWTTGKYGGGLDFDGMNDYVSIGNKPSFQIRDNVSLSVWIKTINDGGQHTSVSRSYAYMVNGPYNNFIEFYGHDGVDGSGCAVGWTYDNSWVHLVAVIRKYTGGWTVKGYVNGVEKCSNTNVNFDGPRDTNEIVDIGRTGGIAGRYFNGAIDDVRIYNRTLSQDEVLTLYNSG